MLMDDSSLVLTVGVFSPKSQAMLCNTAVATIILWDEDTLIFIPVAKIGNRRFQTP